MSFSLFSPGKIILLGEYACLEGAEALVAALKPGFTLSVAKNLNHNEEQHPFAPQSPAGLLIEKEGEVLKDYQFLWEDHFGKLIGVGSSSAQFALVLKAITKISKAQLPDLPAVLKLYWSLIPSNSKTRPSGVDLVAQWRGHTGVAATHPTKISFRPLPIWNDPHSQLVFAFTGSKTKTHEHLKSWDKKGGQKKLLKILPTLKAITEEGLTAWKKNHAIKFGHCLSQYQNQLTDAGFAPLSFVKLLSEIKKWAGVLGYKGCGAQGGDCVVFLVEKKKLSVVQDKIKNLGWDVISAKLI